MRTGFVKYQGTGNDFIIVDNRNQSVHLSSDKIRELCDRHFGIGADGLMLLQNHEGYDFEMLYFNSDGLPGSMCGNGGRCIVRYFAQLDNSVNDFHFLAPDGEHQASIIDSGIVSLKMNDAGDLVKLDDGFLIDTGSPHFICLVSDVDALDVFAEGRKIRYGSAFLEKGVNVNFIEWTNGKLKVRTYERGVENETLSCGTGVTASALLAHHLGWLSGAEECRIITKGGELNVRFAFDHGRYSRIYLEGPAKFVFKGEIEI